jgi:hypothetical protein
MATMDSPVSSQPPPTDPVRQRYIERVLSTTPTLAALIHAHELVERNESEGPLQWLERCAGLDYDLGPQACTFPSYHEGPSALDEPGECP